jgi:hypothetical protein
MSNLNQKVFHIVHVTLYGLNNLKFSTWLNPGQRLGLINVITASYPEYSDHFRSEM